MLIVAKSEQTLKIEQNLYHYLQKMGTFICFEVGIENEIVDCLVWNTKHEWRCYEIKVTKTDFHSKQAKTFVGNFNYFVMPEELYQEVKSEIPDHIGVIIDGRYVAKKPKKQDLSIQENILYYSMIKSLYRDADKYNHIYYNQNIENALNKRNEILNLKSKIKKMEQDNKDYLHKSNEYYRMFRFLKQRAKPEDIIELDKLLDNDNIL